jgi:O-antigen/teichoic acid export membrane protein
LTDLSERLTEAFRGFRKADGFARNVSVLLMGTVGAHLITVLSLPIVSRIFDPEAFSALAVYSAILSIVLTFGTLSVHIGIPIAESHKAAVSLVVISGTTILINTFALGMFVTYGGDWFAGAINRPELSDYLVYLIPGVLAGSGYATLQMWFSRQKRFPLVAGTRVLRAAGGASVQMGCGLAGLGPKGLVIGHTVYHGLGAFGLLKRFLIDERETIRALSRQDIATSIDKSRRFALYTTPENLANVAAIQLPLILIAASPASGEVGHLYLAQTIMMFPMILIGSSVSQVFLTEAPKHYRNGSLWPFMKSVLRGLAITGVPVLVGAGLLAPLLAGPVLGPKWAATGTLISWIMPWMVLQFLSSPISSLFYIKNQQGWAMILQVGGLILRLGVVLVAIRVAPEAAMPAYAVSGAIFYLVMLASVIAMGMKS